MMERKQKIRERKYQVKATKDFLVLALIFFFLGLWAIKDGWYPSESRLRDHPKRIEIPFEINGTVDRVLIKKGDKVLEKQILITLNKKKLEAENSAIMKEYTACRKKYDAARDQNMDSAKIEEIKRNLDEAKERVDKIRGELISAEISAPKSGEIIAVHANSITTVKKGQLAVVIDPKDHFYPFNKVLTVISAICFVVFLFLHLFGS
jgi:multidrug resistance efflux pump